ncbi:MAG: pyrroloquinoline quinone-dependent dehydrogenase, partial [Acidobacteriaceae bacterium]|nr:pyrroloquinoline quinone-dependent dehydrogenase [Acidobacteriaceae bacterium]
PLTQINASNISSLKIAWTYRTGDAYAARRGRPTAFEATPIYVDGTLYLGTPLGSVIALDPDTGKPRWVFRSDVHKDAGYGDFAHRGVSTWKPASGKRRIYIATENAQLIALDAETGKPCSDFGDNGTVNLRHGLRIPAKNYADYEETSPPAVIGNTIVVGSGIADNGATDQPSGEVRALDVQSGKLKWTWDPLPQDAGAPGADTWKNGSAKKTGAANAWSIIVADPARNLVFVPTGSASPDYYGGERLGDNLFANSVVALDADTGKMKWHFQTIHHDLWDYDVASPPLLFDMRRNGEIIPAIGIGSKSANLFILNRETGQPVFGVQERPVPKSDVPGEVASPTQPFPVMPHAVSPQKLTAADAWGSDEDERKACRDEMAQLRSEGVFTPPSERGSLFMPGNIGGMAWGGAAYSPALNEIIYPANNLASEARLIPRADMESRRQSEGRKLNGSWEFGEQRGTPYGMMRRFILSPKGLPCNPPPWGTLSAIDASTGELKWQVPLGRLSGMPGKPGTPPAWGSISLGGPIVTAAGLVFAAGTLDPAIYGFDASTGKQLWKGDLPTSARATPMTFQSPVGKQYLIISAGGHQPAGDAPLGDYVIAFSLN